MQRLTIMCCCLQNWNQIGNITKDSVWQTQHYAMNWNFKTSEEKDHRYHGQNPYQNQKLQCERMFL